MWQALKEDILSGNIKSLARGITLLENDAEGAEEFLATMPTGHATIIGITGPPGAGKSTLTDALVAKIVEDGKKIAILCVDPSSPFNLGALLGDRIRMSGWYNHPDVYIRSLATRGALGGLNAKMIEITSLVKAAGYDYIIIETVGVGQSEVEIAGIADVTIVTIVPEAGDEVQTMKAGLMEIADIFVVNKADRPGADIFVKNLRLMLAPAFHNHAEAIPIIKTIATTGEGITELFEAVRTVATTSDTNDRKQWLLTEKAWQLIAKKRMMDCDKSDLYRAIETAPQPFNLYAFVKNY